MKNGMKSGLCLIINDTNLPTLQPYTIIYRTQRIHFKNEMSKFGRMFSKIAPVWGFLSILCFGAPWDRLSQEIAEVVRMSEVGLRFIILMA